MIFNQADRWTHYLFEPPCSFVAAHWSPKRTARWLLVAHLSVRAVRVFKDPSWWLLVEVPLFLLVALIFTFYQYEAEVAVGDTLPSPPPWFAWFRPFMGVMLAMGTVTAFSGGGLMDPAEDALFLFWAYLLWTPEVPHGRVRDRIAALFRRRALAPST